MNEKYQIAYDPKPWILQVLGSLVFYGFLGFLAWLSRDSTWWTFLFGTLAIAMIFGRLTMVFDNEWHRFSDHAELVKFVNSIKPVPSKGTTP